MRSFQIVAIVALSVTVLCAFTSAQYQHPSQFRPSGGGFIPSVQDENSEEGTIRPVDSTPAAAINYRQQSYEYEEEEDETPTQPPQTRRQQFLRPNNYVAQPSKSNAINQKKRFEEELEEIEEPDRLAILLEKSSFQCEGRTGYYADESVSCEIFHYCHDNQKHSWVCPEGFVFHQVHLICMPPSGDNICQQSSKYHVVNDFLYKALNVEEHETRPNVSLRYSERYYPEEVYSDDRQEQDEEYSQRYENRRSPSPIHVGLKKTPTPTYRTQAQSNAFRSSDDINIPLQQRRPNIVFSPTTTRYEEEEYNYEKK